MVTDTEQIEKYLAGELNSAEMQALEQRLQTDTSFAETFQLYQSIQEEMQADEEEEGLRKNISAVSSKYFTAKQETKIIPMKGSGKKWWLYAAAAACIAVILLVVKPWQDKPMTNEQVLAQYAQPDELTATLRGGNDDSLQINAANAFNKKQYATALPLLDSFTLQKPGEAQFQLSLAICYLETGEYTKAQNKLDEIANGQSAYKYAAMEWKGYNFLKQGKRVDGLAILRQIPKVAANYKKVQEIIQRLSK